MFGKNWKEIANMIDSRTVVQIRTHAQKYFQKLAKAAESKGEPVSETLVSTARSAEIVKRRTSSNRSGRKVSQQKFQEAIRLEAADSEKEMYSHATPAPAPAPAPATALEPASAPATASTTSTQVQASVPVQSQPSASTEMVVTKSETISDSLSVINTTSSSNKTKKKSSNTQKKKKNQPTSLRVVVKTSDIMMEGCENNIILQSDLDFFSAHVEDEAEAEDIDMLAQIVSPSRVRENMKAQNESGNLTQGLATPVDRESLEEDDLKWLVSNTQKQLNKYPDASPTGVADLEFYRTFDAGAAIFSDLPSAEEKKDDSLSINSTNGDIEFFNGHLDANSIVDDWIDRETGNASSSSSSTSSTSAASMASPPAAAGVDLEDQPELSGLGPLKSFVFSDGQEPPPKRAKLHLES